MQQDARLRKEASERLRIERENLHLVRHIQDLGKRKTCFAQQPRYEHVAASAILRRRMESKISRENRQIATRLEQVGDGGIKSSGYGFFREASRGPLAKKLALGRIKRNAPRLQQPEMSF